MSILLVKVGRGLKYSSPQCASSGNLGMSHLSLAAHVFRSVSRSLGRRG